MASADHERKPRTRVWLITSVTCIALALVAGGLVLVVHSRDDKASAAPAAPPPRLTVQTVTPDGTSVPAGSVISVQFSVDLAQGSPMPSITPAIPGTWSVLSPSLLQYQATGPLVPGATETVSIPGGPEGVVGARGQHLGSTVTHSFTVAQGSTLRLQQLLAELGYLPLTFTPSAPVTSPAQEGNDQVGTFSWRWINQAASLTSLWTPGTYNVITKGAVMNFEAQHGLVTDGLAGPKVWAALLAAVQSDQGNPLPYDYVLVSEDLPETATVYSNGNEVYRTLANTGVPGASTALGTFPVYERFTVTTMRGTNPDGSHYVDPGIPWVSYFNGGDALHGFPRASYGFPQSDGCVEMPIANAAVVYPLTPIGTLVTVQ
ncbi:MAG TPA: L,D-transpeptidase family protein [Acidimicrobiales bacterium]|nr:L,D-transpeptidase family protein [Acidimicrobiales bacterium]